MRRPGTPHRGWKKAARKRHRDPDQHDAHVRAWRAHGERMLARALHFARHGNRRLQGFNPW